MASRSRKEWWAAVMPRHGLSAGKGTTGLLHLDIPVSGLDIPREICLGTDGVQKATIDPVNPLQLATPRFETRVRALAVGDLENPRRSI